MIIPISATMHSPHSSPCGTKTAILDTAERLFAQHGFEATSLRAITAEAGANLGAVNYHFTSKDGLILAVLRRRFQPVNDHRLRLLGALEAAAGGRPLAVEAILEALLRPPLELINQASQSGWFYPRLLAYCLTDPGSYLKPLMQDEFANKTQRFHEALQHACPSLSRAEVRWRLHFTTGAFIHTAGNPQLLEVTSQGLCKASDPETVLKRIVGFCAAGFLAPGVGAEG
ncbi:MAG TPA: TetR/AcrR family transcriptional regulator [Chthoniobacteraceae bacterium]|jgi:AcrR family transcriptional regulator|nr:TetR/AcrR family transcriptional regulator [Chthoniobacteraceae bacterium]